MAIDSMRAVEPVRPAAGYIGGKRNLARRLVERIENIPHQTYCEAFVGMGGVFLRRSHAPKSEVINDRSGDVANFFRILQRHYVPFVEMLRWQLTSRKEFQRLAATDPTTLTDLERAARFLYLQRTAFGGKVAGRNFGVSPIDPGRFNVTKLVPMLEDIHERLAGVVIECLDFEEFLDRYDRPYSLFFLDPPYFGSEDFYGAELFSRADYQRLVAALRRLKGRFLLTINDRPETRALFDGFTIEAVETTYTVSGGGRSQRVGEIIVSNSATI
ncbi:DNA adenine methylase [Microvirga terricola]|uniref:site-specific DNA-methyltransferase (adenine-specific) n=1 Tax=Microvirga terricola TaxID=2719797 RepID=A0ABX0V9L5_9HYPH|nr:DNA adenine methylase [Microvirga terricola]NIX75375.1 DNA adenine methylase [Microvirga terricola]